MIVIKMMIMMMMLMMLLMIMIIMMVVMVWGFFGQKLTKDAKTAYIPVQMYKTKVEDL